MAVAGSREPMREPMLPADHASAPSRAVVEAHSFPGTLFLAYLQRQSLYLQLKADLSLYALFDRNRRVNLGKGVPTLSTYVYLVQRMAPFFHISRACNGRSAPLCMAAHHVSAYSCEPWGAVLALQFTVYKLDLYTTMCVVLQVKQLAVLPCTSACESG